jgi:hypothetical protein
MSSEHSSLSLYNLSVEGAELYSIIESMEGELTPEIEARLDELIKVAPERVEAAAMVVQSLQGSASVCQQESMRLAERAAALDKNAQHLKDRMAMIVDNVFGGKVKTNRFTVWTQQSADHVAFDVMEGRTIEDVEKADPSLVRIKKELDKLALKDKFKKGEALPPSVAFTSSQGKRYLRIK